jgi:hypothetical protein
MGQESVRGLSPRAGFRGFAGVDRDRGRDLQFQELSTTVPLPAARPGRRSWAAVAAIVSSAP